MDILPLHDDVLRYLNYDHNTPDSIHILLIMLNYIQKWNALTVASIHFTYTLNTVSWYYHIFSKKSIYFVTIVTQKYTLIIFIQTCFLESHNVVRHNTIRVTNACWAIHEEVLKQYKSTESSQILYPPRGCGVYAQLMLEEMHLSAQIYPKKLELLHKKTSPTESQTCFMFVLAHTAKAVA